MHLYIQWTWIVKRPSYLFCFFFTLKVQYGASSWDAQIKEPFCKGTGPIHRTLWPVWKKKQKKIQALHLQLDDRPNPLAKEELNLLARLMGSMKAQNAAKDESGFRINLFPTDQEEEEEAWVILFGLHASKYAHSQESDLCFAWQRGLSGSSGGLVWSGDHTSNAGTVNLSHLSLQIVFVMKLLNMLM